MPKLRKIVPGGPTWRRRVMELAQSYLEIHSCRSCGSPVNKPYVCMFCDENDP